MTSRVEEQHAQTATTNDPRWEAVKARDPRAAFFYAVRTTGVYCRPSCAARLPRPQNVSFFDTAAAAGHAGFRACKRCRPDGPALAERYAALVARACRRLERAETEPCLAELAAEAGLSPFHFQRVFRRVLGLSPKRYAAAHRDRLLRRRLPGSGSVTEAMYDAGFQSSGRFYSKAQDALGMKPASFRRGGDRETIHFALGETTLGTVLVAQAAAGVCAILLGDDADSLLHELERAFPRAQLLGGTAALQGTVARVISLIEVPGGEDGLPLDIRGTAFQQRVWHALRQLPRGETATYTGIAETLGLPKAVRAVAAACAANRLAVAIPCHRVVRADGGLAGYRWGIERKRALLERESRAKAAIGPYSPL